MQTSLQSVLSGPGCLIEGYRLLSRGSLRPFVIGPLLGNVLLIAVALALCWFTVDWAVAAWLPASWGWLTWLLLPVAILALLWLFMVGFAALANLLLGPFLDRLAVATRNERGFAALEQPHAVGWLAFARQELRRWAYLIVCLLGVLVIGWIPFVQVAAAPLALLVSAWFLVIETSAHAFAIRGVNFSGQLAGLRQHRGSALAFGLAASGALLLPVFNLLLVPAAVIGMTLWVEQRIAE